MPLSTSKVQLLTVIIPTRGRSHKLAVLLDALDTHSSKAKFEVIVIVDGQGDVPDGARSYALETIHTDHVGAGGARNLGIARARGEAVLFLNDDVIPSEELIDAHVEMLEAGHRAVLGYSPWREFDSPTVFDAMMVHTPAIFNQAGLVDGQCYDFRHGWTLNLSVRLDAVGRLDQPFDPRLRPIYFEDIDFAHRCFGEDPKIVYCERAKAVHDHWVTIREYFAREVLLGMMSVVLFETNRRCYELIFPCAPNEHAQRAAGGLMLDVRDHRRIIERLINQADEPAGGVDRVDRASALYDLHLLIKRRAFRVGLCAMCEEVIEWDQRVARAGALLAGDPVLGMLADRSV